MVDHVVGLLALGHDVELFCPPEVVDVHPLFPKGVQVHRVPLSCATPNRAWSPTPIAPVVLDRLRALRAHAIAVGRLVAGGRFDVLYAGACRLTRAPLVAVYAETPSVLYLGEPYRWLYEALPELPLAAKPFRQRKVGPLLRVGWLTALRRQARFEVSAARAFDRILVNSRFSRESVLRSYGLEASVCRLGIDVSRFEQSCVADRRHQVIGIGAIVPEKRVTAAIDAVARVSEPRPTLHWIGNVGDPNYIDQCRRAAKDMSVELKLSIGVSEEELADELRRSKVMIYAPRLEPFGYAPLEAAAAGVPVVALAEGGIRETVIDGVTGLLVDESRELAPALDSLLVDERTAARLGQQARQSVASLWNLSESVLRVEEHLTAVAQARA
jgi:glycosyltransferase involved in cell wall biosynthesis